jgi:hypothetical protein
MADLNLSGVTPAALGAAMLAIIAQAQGGAVAPAPDKGKRKLTSAGSHVATAKGYANGVVIEEGEPVPADIPVSTEWMKRVDGKAESAFERAIADVLDPLPDDPDLTQLSVQALQALATEAGATNVEGLSDDELISVIKAADDPKR